MYTPKPWYVLLILLCAVSGAPAFAQTSSVEDELAQLRREVAELKAQLQQLQSAAGKPAAPAPAAAAPAQAAPSEAQVDKLQQQVKALEAKTSQPPTAGWNGEHFFLRSSDGNFTLMPIGYVQPQYTVYGNTYGAPTDSFAIRTARLGVEGNYGKQIDYVFTMEATASPALRDAYLDIKPWSFLKFMGGQFKVPFSMEVGTADTAVDFAYRSIISILYPDAAGSYRAPGLDIHGDFENAAVEYWVGVFNGQGLLASGTTNEPEIVGRLRFTPWRNTDLAFLKGLSFGGSYEHSRSKGLAGEKSFSGTLPDNTYTFFPQFAINGNVNRYNGFLSYLNGPLGIRGEYVHLQQDREAIGSLTPGGIAFVTQPPVVGSGWYASAIYFLTGESDPQNALPRVRHPLIGPASPGETGAPGWGAWAVKFRYARLQGNAPGSSCDATTTPACPITPVISPGFNYYTDEAAVGFNWYLNYWVLLKTDFVEDQLKYPSVQGILPHNYFVFIETLQFRF